MALVVVTTFLVLVTGGLVYLGRKQVKEAHDATAEARRQTDLMIRQTDVLSNQAEAARAGAEATRIAAEEMRAARAQAHPLSLDLEVAGEPGVAQVQLINRIANSTMLVDHVTVRQVLPALSEPLADQDVRLTIGAGDRVLAAHVSYDYQQLREMLVEVSGRPLDGVAQIREWRLRFDDGRLVDTRRGPGPFSAWA